MIVKIHCGDCGKCCHFPDGDCEYLDGMECMAIDKDRPAMCDLYPFVVATEDDEIKLFVDSNCPHIPLIELSDVLAIIKAQHESKRLKVPTAQALRDVYEQKLVELITL